MPRPLRVRFEGAFYHVFNRGVEKRLIYFDDKDRVIFIEILGEFAIELCVQLLAYCLMDNHFHLFVHTPLGNVDIFMQRAASKYVRYINGKYRRVGGLFQGRYKSKLVPDDSYALALLSYIHENPLEAGYDPYHYRWSSLKAYVGNEQKPWLNTQLLLKG